MYVKIFSKLLDSSIWLEPTPTRIVWLTLLVSMDETGYAHFASVGNLARRAIVSLDEARAAVKALEGPDPDSSDPEDDGRRIERVPGGWIVKNAPKHRALATRAAEQEANRIRAAKHRAKQKVTVTQGQSVTSNGHVTQTVTGNGVSNGTVPPTETEASTEASTDEVRASATTWLLRAFYDQWGSTYSGATYKAHRADAAKAETLERTYSPAQLRAALRAYFAADADAFYADNRHPFAVFADQVNRLMVVTEAPSRVPNVEKTAAYIRSLKGPEPTQ